jgi:hypothetical protein
VVAGQSSLEASSSHWWQTPCSTSQDRLALTQDELAVHRVLHFWVVVSQLSPLAQSEVVRQGTQRWTVVSQTGLGAWQCALVKHSTQRAI